jgi:glycosyltransferase involved in cell wall biosynthesis
LGDRVVTASGEYRPIKWIGHRSYGGTLPVSPNVQPIRFRAGSLGGGLPRRDLLVSPEHAMVLDGQLIPARGVVNGRSILRETGLGQVTYFHIELDSHDVLLAEGAPAESFLDDNSRGLFHNAREYRVLYPDEAPHPAVYCLPRLEEGEALEQIRLRLAALAEPVAAPGPLEGFLDGVKSDLIRGWAQDMDAPETPVRLQISDNGVILGEVLAQNFRADLVRAGQGSGCHAFEMRIPGGLSPAIRHVIDVRRVADGERLHGGPVVVQPVFAAEILALPTPEAPLVPWRGMLDSCTRDRLTGWAQDTGSDAPVLLQVLDNGLPLARILANRLRPDLQQSGIGTGAYGFDITIPGGLSPLTRHLIEVRRVSDGAALPGSPVVLETADRFDAGLEQAVAAAVAALPAGEEQTRVLSFMLAQAEQLAKARADADGQRQARETRAKDKRRWGPHATPGAPGLRALVINAALPVATHDGGSSALLSHIAALQSLGYAVSLVAADAMDADGAALAAYGISVCGAPFYSCVEDVLRRQAGCFDAVYLHRVDMASRYLALARRHAPRARVLYSVADLHHLRIGRQALVQDEPGLLDWSRALRAAECHAAAAADAVITHSAEEAAWLRQAAPSAQVHHVPWSVTPQAKRRGFAKRQGVALIGHYGHAPNADAASWLVGAVMPLVWQAQPEIECILVGSDMPPAIQALAGPGVRVLGHVTRLGDVLDRVRLTVAPLRFGAGVKAKVLDSMAAGVPCVMTPIAAEGLGLPPLLQAMVGADAAALAALICGYHGDATRHKAAAQAGLALIQDAHSEAVVAAALQGALGGAWAEQRRVG